MLKIISTFLIGIFLGAISWAICPILFDTFEPFDTGPGLLFGQALMIIFLTYVGWRSNIKNVLLAILGLYIGQNLYAYIFGSSETRAWALLLLFTSIFLCVLPLFAGIIARGLKVSREKNDG